MLHILPGGLLLILAPFQFSAQFRNRHIRFHRRSGRVLVGSAVASTLAGFYFGLRMPYGGAAEAAAVVVFGGSSLFPSRALSSPSGAATSPATASG